MMLRSRLSILGLVVSLFASAQAAAAGATVPVPTASSPSGDTGYSVTLGDSAIRLYGPWKFPIGDSLNADSNPD